jgi:hypothetical protein
MPKLFKHCKLVILVSVSPPKRRDKLKKIWDITCD